MDLAVRIIRSQELTTRNANNDGELKQKYIQPFYVCLNAQRYDHNGTNCKGV